MLRHPSLGSKPSRCCAPDSAEQSRNTQPYSGPSLATRTVGSGLTSTASDTDPAGLGQALVAEHHYAEYLNPLAHIHGLPKHHPSCPPSYHCQQGAGTYLPANTRTDTMPPPVLDRSLQRCLLVSCAVKVKTALTTGCATA